MAGAEQASCLFGIVVAADSRKGTVVAATVFFQVVVNSVDDVENQISKQLSVWNSESRPTRPLEVFRDDLNCLSYYRIFVIQVATNNLYFDERSLCGGEGEKQHWSFSVRPNCHTISAAQQTVNKNVNALLALAAFERLYALY